MPNPLQPWRPRSGIPAKRLRGGRAWARRNGTLLALPIAALVATAGRCQEPPGCKMLGDALECAAGVGIAPLQRIPIVLPAQGKGVEPTSGDPAPGGNGTSLVLEGRAQQGAWLRANLMNPSLKSLPDSAYHWYHKPPGRLRWELITGASGPTYQLQRDDMAYDVMVLVANPSPGGSQRLRSNTVGPVMALGASAP